METAELGTSDLAVSRLAFGGCPMGGHGWGVVTRHALIRAVGAALDSGLNFFDTADVYGLGEAERTLGEALGRRRAEAVIATKFGVRVEGGNTFYDNSPAWIRSALDRSLRRLATDYVDLYQIHYRDGSTPLEAVVDALQQLRDQGKVRYFGLSNVERAEFDPTGLATTFTCVQNELSLANRSHEDDIRALAADFGLTPLTWGSLGQGVLTGKYDSTSVFGPEDRRSRPTYLNFQGAKLAHNLRIVEALRTVAGEVGRSVPAVAIRWILDHVPGSVAITGIKDISQLESNLDALGWNLPADAITALNEVSMAPEDVR